MYPSSYPACCAPCLPRGLGANEYLDGILWRLWSVAAGGSIWPKADPSLNFRLVQIQYSILTTKRSIGKVNGVSLMPNPCSGAAGAMLAQAISPPPRCAGFASRSLTASLPRRAGGGESIFGGALRHAAVAGLNYQVIKWLLTAVAPTASSFRGYPDYRSRAYRHDVVIHTELAFAAQEEIHLFV